MSFDNFLITVALDEPNVIRAYTDNKEVFTFVTMKQEIHFTDAMLTMVILKGLINEN